MSECLFVSDLHGRSGRVHALVGAIAARRPAAVFIGGDLLPSFGSLQQDEEPGTFTDAVFAAAFARLRTAMGDVYPRVFLILGNDDPRIVEDDVVSAGADGLWEYAHQHEIVWDGWRVIGYACVPPTPFRLKDWERYDVSRSVDPGCVSPEEGVRSVPADPHEVRYGTIARDLSALAPDGPLDRTIWLFHSPPYRTALDRADIGGRSIDHVPLDPHVGSIAIRRFIEEREPAITLHGHIHESARLTGRWLDHLGNTVLLSAAHDGPELAVVTFDRECPHAARRDLLPVP